MASKVIKKLPLKSKKVSMLTTNTNKSNKMDKLDKLDKMDKIVNNVAFKYDMWYPWTNKSDNIAFKSTTKCVGNGEKKLAKELNIETSVGGQNSTIDLVHQQLGNISVKDFTNDDCILGVNGSSELSVILNKTAYPLLLWTEKYRDKCDHASKVNDQIKKSYGKSSIGISDGIPRRELSSSNFMKLSEILEQIKNHKKKDDRPLSLNSEYVNDICDFLGDESLMDKCDECVRKEAIDMTLIIVHKKNGWMIVKDVSKISCPRITRGSPRIKVDF